MCSGRREISIRFVWNGNDIGSVNLARVVQGGDTDEHASAVALRAMADRPNARQGASIRFCETNPPFFLDFFDATSYLYDTCV
jgi:hypothetical protein